MRGGAGERILGKQRITRLDEGCRPRPATADALFGLTRQRLVGERKSGELIAEELFVDRAGEGDGIDRQASDLLRLRFLEVTGELI